jgi:hypothetical protein
MTDPTPTTTQTPPEGLMDAQLLELAEATSDFELCGVFPIDCVSYYGVNGCELIDYARAAIAADRAARPAPALVPTFLDAIRLALGCHGYSGGYECEAAEVYHAGIATVVDILRRAATRPWDSQTAAVLAMGAACLDTPAPTPEEIEAQFRAWFQQEHGLPPSPTATAHAAAFALHLLGGEVAA